MNIKNYDPSALTGVYTALITPFLNSGEIDWFSFDRLIELQLAAKVSGILVCGTTGETPTLTPKEIGQLISRALTNFADPWRVIVGTGSNSTAATISNCKFAADCGAEIFLISTPYYNKPTQEGLFYHFSSIAEQFPDKKIILYDVPGRTCCHLNPETTLRLQEKFFNITGIKDASGSVEKMKIIKASAREDFKIFAGDDGLLFDSMIAGADGVISVASNIIPQVLNQIVLNFQKGKINESKNIFDKHLELFNRLFVQTNPIPVKWALASRGIICSDFLRLPLLALEERYRPIVAEELNKCLK